MTHMLENNYTRSSHTVVKALGPTTDFPTWGSGKGTENPRGLWRWRPMGFDYRISTRVQKQTLGEHKQNLICTQDPGERSHDPTRDWARLARECPRVSSEGVGQLWPAGKSETLNTIVLGAKASSINPFEGSWHCHHYPCHSLASGQTIRREHNPTINKKLN